MCLGAIFGLAAGMKCESNMNYYLYVGTSETIHPSQGHTVLNTAQTADDSASSKNLQSHANPI